MIYKHTLENLFNMRPEWLNEKRATERTYRMQASRKAKYRQCHRAGDKR